MVNNEKKFGEILNKCLGGDVELSLNDLEGVAGGVITQEQQDQLLDVLKNAKSSGMSKEEVLGYVPMYFPYLHPQYPNVEQQEVLDFINDNWDSI